MNTRRTFSMWLSGVVLVLLCVCGIPLSAFAGTYVPVPTGPLDAVNGTPDYYTTANWANSPKLAKFVDTLPGLGAGKTNNLDQYIPIAVPDKDTYPGSDYYIIELQEYFEKMHSNLNLTKLRGYVQVDAAGVPVAPIHYLGPVIVAERDRPVRIKFTNRLPSGPAGDLFIPVDTSVMGAGTGPALGSGVRGGGTPCFNDVEPNGCDSYTQNRAAIHLHGGRTPWISDGTPHQWITPVEENTPFTKGVSLQNVPDMPDPGDGSTTYYFSNQQSARLMFYHDHAFGITRLNVYAGEAAGYVVTDKWEKDLVSRKIIPEDQIPLIIQDKTFVDATPTTKYIYNPATGLFDTPITVAKVRETDPLWNWGSAAPDVNGVRPPVTGDLWLPHVYMPAQNPLAGSGGVNPFGRWMYGPWFYPATAIPKGPVANPYYDADCSSPFPAVYANCQTPGQPHLIPGTPNVSMGMEAFHDTAVVNGTVFPSLTVDPRAYRFRILNAASDRFQNLSFYVADPAQVSPDLRPASRLTEVKMVPASAQLAADNNWPPLWPVDGRDGGVPDPGTCTGSGATLSCPNLGPSFLQIGTEGGFLPKPVEIKPQPVTYITDPTAFWVGVVDKTGLALGPAERADVIVDFSAYAGQTLILYNDAPAAWPARVPGYDYYTGAPDMRDSGGYGTGGTFNQVTGAWEGGTGPLVGYAPNTRTVMQVIVRPAGSQVDGPYNFSRTNLENEFTSAAPVVPGLNEAPTKTLFERAQEPIIVGQAAYSAAYPNSYFPPNFPWEGVNQINDHFLKFVTLAGEPVQINTEPKGIHDEMGASFDPIYGRMSGNLAMQLPNPTTLNAVLVLYGFSDLPTEFINNSTSLNVQVLQGTPATIPWQVTDGTQIWKISHNGVDTHPIHFHIFDVQLINRVGWDGQIALPEPNELGWKDTVKISPLMDTIVAVRPRAPLLPFGITNSVRPLNPSIPVGSMMGLSQIDWTTGQAYAAPSPYANGVTNELYNFGWEYVWHCHILSHEEMDMMRPIVLNVPSSKPATPDLSAAVQDTRVNLVWTDATPAGSPSTMGNPGNEIGFKVFRCTSNCITPAAFTQIATVQANSTGYSDTDTVSGTTYSYIVSAFNASGDSDPSNTASSSLIITDAPGWVGASISSISNISVWWPASATPDATYTVRATPTVGAPVVVSGITGTSTLLTGLANGTYTITVRADKIGQSSSAAVAAANTITIDKVVSAPAWSGASVSNISDISVWWAVSQTAGATYTVTATPAGGGAATVVSGIAGTSTLLPNLANGTYTISVHADLAGWVSSGETPAGTSLIIDKLVAAPGWVIASVSGYGINVMWATTSTAGATYTVTATPAAGAPVTVAGVAGTSTLLSSLPDGAYTISVTADKTGWTSSAATIADGTFTITRSVSPVAWVGASVASISNIKVWWAASSTPGATYTITATPVVGVPVVVSGFAGTTTTLSNVPNGVYTVTVRADLAGWTSSAAVAAAAVTINKMAPAPAWLGVQKAGTSGIKLWWPTSSVPGAGYILTRTAGPGAGATVTSGFLTSGSLQYIVLTGLLPGTYSYTVTTTAAGYSNSIATPGAASVTLP